MILSFELPPDALAAAFVYLKGPAAVPDLLVMLPGGSERRKMTSPESFLSSTTKLLFAKSTDEVNASRPWKKNRSMAAASRTFVGSLQIGVVQLFWHPSMGTPRLLQPSAVFLPSQASPSPACTTPSPQ